MSCRRAELVAHWWKYTSRDPPVPAHSQAPIPPQGQPSRILDAEGSGYSTQAFGWTVN